MQALRDVFDSNKDGVLNASDADWQYFKVLVTVHAKRGSATTADGTTTLKSLSDLGITSINLQTTNIGTTFADGSSISGTTTFTVQAEPGKGEAGATQTAASVSFATDANGYTVQSTTTVNADGSTTIDNKALTSDGSLANETVSTTSANGLTRRLEFDNTGNGVFDQAQTGVMVARFVRQTAKVRAVNTDGKVSVDVLKTAA
jgi:hypothetical protein